MVASCAFCRRPHIGIYAVTSSRGDPADALHILNTGHLAEYHRELEAGEPAVEVQELGCQVVQGERFDEEGHEHKRRPLAFRAVRDAHAVIGRAVADFALHGEEIIALAPRHAADSA